VIENNGPNSTGGIVLKGWNEGRQVRVTGRVDKPDRGRPYVVVVVVDTSDCDQSLKRPRRRYRPYEADVDRQVVVIEDPIPTPPVAVTDAMPIGELAPTSDG
jgi:hypothetical protein